MTTMTGSVVIGSDAVIQGTFRDADGDLTTPTAYTVTYKPPTGPDQTIPQGDIIVVSTGVLEAVVPTNEAGIWRYVWNVTIGGYELVVGGGFCVDPIFEVVS